MTEYLEKVREFQRASDQTLNRKPELVNMKDEILRYELMREENEEYFTACRNNNTVEVLDALVDQMYILLGTINTHGMQDVFEEAFNRVHDNNMTKVVDGKVIRNADGKILKPEGFVPVNLEDLV